MTTKAGLFFRKLGFVSLVYFASATNTVAQTREADSLANRIRTERSDTARIMLMIERNKFLGLDSAIYYNLQIMEAARRIRFYRGELEARQTLALNYIHKNDFDAAKDCLNSLRSFIRPSRDSAELSRFYGNHGMFYGVQSKYDSSIQYYDSSIRIAVRHNLDNLGSSYSGISIGYQQLGNYAAALEYQQKGLRFVEKTNDENTKARLLLNTAITYENIGDLEKAEDTYQESLNLALKLGLKRVETYAYSNLANLYIRQKKWQEAYDIAMKSVISADADKGIKAAGYAKAVAALLRMDRLEEAYVLGQKAIKIADSTDQPLNISQAYKAMGDYYFKQKKYKEAIPFYLRSKDASINLSLYSAGTAAEYKSLAECYEQTGDYHLALQNFKRSADISDSVTRKDNIRRTTELSMNFDFEKKQNEIAEENRKAALIARNRQYILLGGLISVLILGIISYIGYRGKQRANKRLSDQKKQIESTLAELRSAQAQLIQSEKMASLGELTAGIAHEIQNPLNFVNNFSEVSNELMDEMKEEMAAGHWQSAGEIAQDVKRNLEKINHHGKRAGAIVRGMLQHSRGSAGKKELTDINNLCDEYLRLSYHGLRAKDKSFNSAIETRFDKTLGHINIVSQDIGRVLLNLLNNAFYAVNAREAEPKTEMLYQPLVTLITSRINGNVEITVKDNGSGIPRESTDKIFQPFFTTKPTGKGTGLGLSLAYDIVKAHGGKIWLESEEGLGTEFTVQLPLA